MKHNTVLYETHSVKKASRVNNRAVFFSLK